MQNDLMERLVAEWGDESPGLDPSALLVVGRIMRLGRRFEAEAAAALKEFGLSYTEFDIIATLKRSGPPYTLTPGQLIDAVLLTSGAMTAALDRLQAASLITRETSASDRRVRAAKLTAKGRRLAERAAAARFEVAAAAIEQLSARDRKLAQQLLKRLDSTAC